MQSNENKGRETFGSISPITIPTEIVESQLMSLTCFSPLSSCESKQETPAQLFKPKECDTSLAEMHETLNKKTMGSKESSLFNTKMAVSIICDIE